MTGDRVHDDLRQTSVSGVRGEFRAYLTEDGDERLIWRIGNQKGRGASFNAKACRVYLPKGREVTVNGERKTSLKLPRWLGDGLAEDFNDLDDNGVSE